jgi:L-aspartate oxidase
VTEITRLDAPLVVGAGVAGLTVALGLPRAYVVTAAEMGSTWWAQGGIAVALSPDDSPRQHADDTLSVSAGLGVERVVDLLTGAGPEAVENLIALGAEFDRDDDGELLLAREGGHQTRRVLHADGDATGAEVMRALTAAVEAGEKVTMIQRRVLDLVMVGDRVAGVVANDGKNREVFLAPAVVLATGGAGRLFSHTTNPSGVTGDGIAMAGRVGARLADLEFVQFHPTALEVGKDPMPLLTEALRGEGALLVDAHGRRFLPQYHPMAELAPRDIVARAIFWQYDRGLGGAYLDASSIVNFADRFPTVNAHAISVGLDPSQHLLPVSPAAHYYMGGIDADANGRTTVPALWAVGECSSTGAHGANRLASNSLLEGLVFGARVAADVVDAQVDPVGELRAPKEAFDLPLVAGPALEDLRQIMWDRAGLVRTGSGLWEARNHLLDLDSVLRRTIAGRVAVELALMVIMAALRRSESRGGHYRADYPESDPMQEHRTLLDPTRAELAPVT